MATLSQLELLPGEIFEHITDKLTYYQYFSLGVCNSTLLASTLGSDSFWRHRLWIDFWLIDPIERGRNISACKEVYIDKLTHLRSIVESARSFENGEQTNIIHPPSHPNEILSKSHYERLFDDFRLCVKCQIPNSVEKLFHYIEYVINNLSTDNFLLGLYSNKAFINSMLKIPEIWTNKHIKMNNNFCYNLITNCVRYDCMEVLNKHILRPKTNKIVTGLTILNALLPLHRNQDLDPNLRDEAINLGLSLVRTVIDLEDRVRNFVYEYGIRKIAATIVMFREMYDGDVTDREISNKVVTELLAIISSMDYVIAREIYRKLIIIINRFPSALSWFLLNLPEVDLDDLFVFKATFPTKPHINRYKKVIRIYCLQYPNCISKHNYDRIMNM